MDKKNNASERKRFRNTLNSLAFFPLLLSLSFCVCCSLPFHVALFTHPTKRINWHVDANAEVSLFY
ncbi:hypothetical protein Lal_00030900 [Lupinus albus]|nr:hypothetical protein Lal_00030900 [Lupinus albus]